MKDFFTIVGVLLGLVFILFLVTSVGCAQVSSAPVAQIVEPITEIRIEKAIISLAASYDIYKDGEMVGTVTGKFLPLFGDTFTYSDLDGNVIAKEHEQKRLLNLSFNRQADITDANDEITGYIGEEIAEDFFNIGYTFHFYDKDQNEIGFTRQVLLSILGEQDIFDSNGEVIAKINKELSLFANKYTISIYKDTLSESDLIFFGCMIDAIQTAEKADRAEDSSDD